MLTTIELDSFQGFEFSQSVRLAPITFVFGPNSGGKSSLLRALRFLGQWDTQDQKFSFSGPLVRLGGYESAVFSGDSQKHFKLGLWHEFGRGIRQSLGPPAQRGKRVIDYSLNTRSFAIDYEFDSKGAGVPLQIELRHEFSIQFPRYLQRDGKYVEKSGGKTVNFDLSPFADGNYSISMLFRRRQIAGEFVFELKGRAGDGLEAMWVLSTASPDSANLPEVIGIDWAGEYSHLSFKLDNALPSLGANVQLESLEQRLLHQYLFSCRREIQIVPTIRYIGPLRQIAQGFDAPSSDSNLAADGSNIARFIASLSPDQLAELNGWLRRLTEDRFEVQVLNQDVGKGGVDSDGFRLTGETLSAMFLRDRHTKTTISLMNAGVGISQVLPILAQVASWSAPDKRGLKTNLLRSEILVVEQPELHLHPRMQADFATVLVDALLDKRDSGLPRRQALIETHSESILLRVQKLIRDGVLTPSDISVLYVDKFPGGGNIAQELRLDLNGRFIDTWPSSFSELRWAEDELG